MTKENVTDVTPKPAEGSEQGEANTGAIPEELKAFMEEVRGKFTQVGKDLGKMRERVKDAPSKPKADESEATPTPTVSPADLEAAMAIGRTEAQLSAEQIKSAQSLREALGLDFQGYATLLDNMKQSATGATPAAPKPPTHGATPAPNKAGVPVPTTLAQWRALTPAQQDALMSDSAFDITKIRR